MINKMFECVIGVQNLCHKAVLHASMLCSTIQGCSSVSARKYC
jgi:hypothetical protein